jgi:hypothetical protein
MEAWLVQLSDVFRASSGWVSYASMCLLSSAKPFANQPDCQAEQGNRECEVKRGFHALERPEAVSRLIEDIIVYAMIVLALVLVFTMDTRDCRLLI